MTQAAETAPSMTPSETNSPSMPAASSSGSPALYGLAQLMGRVYAGETLDAEAQALLARAQQGDAVATLDLSVLLQLRGDEATGLALQQEALCQQQHYQLFPRVAQSPLRVLALVAPGNLMTNTPFEFIADGAGFQLDLLYLSPELPRPLSLPEHDVAIVALSELERNNDCLDMLKHLVVDWPRPLLNAPSAISRLGRDEISHRLQGQPGLEMPITAKLRRSQLQQLAGEPALLPQMLSDGSWPLIIRPLDSHAGNDLECVADALELSSYLDRVAGEHFYLSRYVQYASKDGQFRKYRIVLIDGEPHLAHMAISDHWMVHYLSAGMVESEVKRQEEADTMASFAQNFATKHRDALAAIHRVTGMDYFGIDCAETPDGRLLAFEVCASLNVHAMDPVDIFPYKQPQMHRLFTAFESMLLRQHLNYRIDRRRAAAPSGEPPRDEPDQAQVSA